MKVIFAMFQRIIEKAPYNIYRVEIIFDIGNML